jgi:iron(III) transport system permease protein
MSLAVFLMLLANFVLYISTFVVGKRKYITVSGKSTRPNTVDLGRWRVFFTVLMFLFAFIMIVLPFVTVGLTSITKNLGKSVWEKGNFTTMHWSRIFSRKDVFLSVKNSLLYAVITATFGIIVSVVMANLLERTTIKGRRIPIS